MENQHIVCINPSKQEANVGVAGYGNEEDNAHIIGNRVKDILDWNGGFVKVYCTPKTMSLADGIRFSNDIKATIHVDIHTNAWMKKNRGCQACYKTPMGMTLAKCLYDEVSKLTPTADEGLKFRKDLGALNQTNAVAALIEMFYHDNVADVEFYKAHKEEFARAIARGIMKYCGVVERQEPQVSPFPMRKVTATVLNVRNTPCADSPVNVIGQLLKDEKVRVGYDRGDGWSNIFYGMHGGWVATRYLK